MGWIGLEHIDNIKIEDLMIEQLGEPEIESPLTHVDFVNDTDRIAYYSDVDMLKKYLEQDKTGPSFERAGPRSKLYHDPAWMRAAIVTCGGLCPGLNDVIKGIVNTLCNSYGVRNVLGIRYGYRGLSPKYELEPMTLTPDNVDSIHEDGGTILGASRGQQSNDEIVMMLHRMNVNTLFCIGGDGTLRAAGEICDEIKKRDLRINVIGVPKTIDNDVSFTEKTFGFETAVYSAAPVITCAHDEAGGAYNGIGLIKLMGRDSGFIASSATLANSLVNFCLIPEVPFELEGPHGLLPALKYRLKKKNHCVIIVAEGAGQHLFKDNKRNKDASGNVLHEDIGAFLKNKISEYMKREKIDHTIKYFDPSYMIRGVPARGTDAIFCYHLAEHAAHAAMAGKTKMIVGQWHSHFTYVPIEMATTKRRKVNPNSQLWQSVLGVTRQNYYFDINE